MAYVVDWIAKAIVIPVSDLVLVSGTRYRLDLAAFLAECRRLEWAFADGLWAESILNHVDAQLDFAGSDYAAFDKVINGYTVQFSPPATRVDLVGSNNNIIDVFIVNGISVVPSNSAGLQKVSIETSVLTAEQSTQLKETWQLQGLDIDNPMTVTPLSRIAGGIQLFLSGDGITFTTVSRSVIPVNLIDENLNNVADENGDLIEG